MKIIIGFKIEDVYEGEKILKGLLKNMKKKSRDCCGGQKKLKESVGWRRHGKGMKWIEAKKKKEYYTKNHGKTDS